MLRILDLRRGDEVPSSERAALDPEVLEGTRAIVSRVREEGDDALVDLTRTLDGADISSFLRVPSGAIAEADGRLDPALRRALRRMADRLQDLHERQLPEAWEAERDGVRYGEVVRPLPSVGCYVPGGRASYPSSVLMTVVPAAVAGVERIALCTPPAQDGSIADAVLVAARLAGAHEVYRVGGAQAIAALAYGTESIPPVAKIVGPGNAWVTAAKREVAGRVGIDALAGPTELAIVADATADPRVLAVDLVAQAEHDPQARTWLVCLESELAVQIEEPLRAEVERSPRRAIVEEAIGRAVAIVVPDLESAAAAIDRLAPEHLQVLTADPRGLLDRLPPFGAAFLGPHTPVSFGDYGVGSNHVLPTMTTARFGSGLRASEFVTVSSVVESSPEGLAALGDEVAAVARAEGLDAHARAVEVRR